MASVIPLHRIRLHRITRGRDTPPANQPAPPQQGAGQPATTTQAAPPPPADSDKRVPFGREEMELSFAPLVKNTAPAVVTEMSPKKEVVWKYEAKPKEGYKGRVEVHAFERLAYSTL